MSNLIPTSRSTSTLPSLGASVDEITTASITELNHFISNRFSHRWIRDMAWALLTPNFFSQWPEVDGVCLFDQEPSAPIGEPSAPIGKESSTLNWQESLTPIWQDNSLMDWLHDLDKNLEPLAAHMQTQRATRLGIYFEQLLSFYFSHYPRFRLLAKNLQANGSQRTIGEYDFIVWDKHNQQHYHIEVAVKFYVGFPEYGDNILNDDVANIPNNPPIYNWHQWIGPNKRDSLGIKVKHLLTHQLRLANTPEGASALATIGLTPEQVKPKLLLTGRLYLNYLEKGHQQLDDQKIAIKETDHHSTPQKQSHANLPQHGHYQTPFTQYWFDQQLLLNNPQWLDLDTTNDVVYIILSRQLWMSNLTPADIDDNDVDVLSPKAFFDVLNSTTDKQLPLHVAQLMNGNQAINTEHTEKKDQQTTLKETQRFFIL